MNLVYVADNRGRILSEFSCIRIGEDNFVLITAANAQWHDGEMIRNSVPQSVSIRENHDRTGYVDYHGPLSRGVLAGITDADLSKGWLTHQFATVAGRKAFDYSRLFRR